MPLQPDRRVDGRQIAVLRMVKIKSGMREGWGMVKNLSRNGMMLEVHPDFMLDKDLTVSLGDFVVLTGKIKWRQNSSVGIQFERLINVEQILSKASEKKNGHILRSPRIEMRHPVSLHLGSRTITANISDISPTGVCLETDTAFETGKKLTLRIPNMEKLGGVVRWRSGSRAGIAFEKRLPINELMRWMSTHYRKELTGRIHGTTENEDPVRSASNDASAIFYNIVGYDDLANQIPVATVPSATLALTFVSASARYFGRVAVTNHEGVELPLVILMQHKLDEARPRL